MIITGEAIGDLAGVIYGFGEVVLHGRKIICRASLCPHLVSGRRMFTQFRQKPGWHLNS